MIEGWNDRWKRLSLRLLKGGCKILCGLGDVVSRCNGGGEGKVLRHIKQNEDQIEKEGKKKMKKAEMNDKI